VTHDERDNLNAERHALQGLIDSIPSDDVIDRASFESRLRDVTQRLANGNASTRLPLSAKLTFRGRPVVGSQGVYAEFGMAATQAFTEAVTVMAASLAGPLSAMGPIPNREQHQLIITGTAVGSFGFQLEEPGESLFVGEDTSVGQALSLTQKLLESTTGSDDDMTEATAGIDPRVIKATRAFLETLSSRDAVCGLTVGNHAFAFSDVAQVRRAVERLSDNNLHEDAQTFSGVFQGVLPKARTFEFLVQPDQFVIRGKVGSGIPDPASLNQHLIQPITISLTATRIGNGRPKYVLHTLPQWSPPAGG
jgi:hypothetical protein